MDALFERYKASLMTHRGGRNHSNLYDDENRMMGGTNYNEPYNG